MGYKDSLCLYLNIYLTLCQIIGLICYIFGIYKIDENFIRETSQHMSRDNIKNNRKHIFSEKYILNKEICCISFLFLFAYSSALIIIIDIFPGKKGDNDHDDDDYIYYIIIIVTDLIDFLRYTPSAIIILFIRLYFNTFTSELTAFRQKHGIITRFEKT